MLACTLSIALPLHGALAQFVPAGERSYNSAIYKASHNSYVRDESLASQIDDFNVWQIELDVYDYGQLYVNHDCVAPFTGADTLTALLQKLMNESTTLARKFTMIYLDMKGNGNDGCQIGWGSALQQRLKDAFLNTFGMARIYSSGEFSAKDGSQWPSYQELVRRGHEVGVIVDWHGSNPAPSDDLFFYATSTNPPDSGLAPNTVLVNVDGGCDDFPSGTAAPAAGLRWLSRMYPSGRCSLDCQEMNGNYWSNGLSKRYVYLATNCVDWEHTFSSSTQSPDPLFVAQPGAVDCPMSYGQCEWGTVRFPFHDLGAAIDRASPMVTLVVHGGIYVITRSGTPRIIDHSMVLTTDSSGPAEIR